MSAQKEIKDWISKRTAFCTVRAEPLEISKVLSTPLHQVLFVLEKMRENGDAARKYILRCEDCDDIVTFSDERKETFKCLDCGQMCEVDKDDLRVIYEIPEDE